LAFAKEQIEVERTRADALQVALDIEREARIEAEAFWTLGVIARLLTALKRRRPG
jgi:hypothetical protein